MLMVWREKNYSNALEVFDLCSQKCRTDAPGLREDVDSLLKPWATELYLRGSKSAATQTAGGLYLVFE
jgi:hypothetical protein